MKRPIVAIKLDGGLREGKKPFSGAIKVLKKEKEKHNIYIVILVTPFDIEEVVEKWLKKHKVPYDCIYDTLPPWDMYIGDKCICHTKIMDEWSNKILERVIERHIEEIK
jgi:ribonucleotide monophosphatase NagD (HAD superfamily)